ncbi:MAG: hypothetical protein GXO10_04425 [Crenarchaeota archaeon]|nr:hypothetical protein [Thermoproteota archaeon]
MWNLYIEVIAVLTIITIVITLLAVYVISNIHVIQLCQATNMSISYKLGELTVLTEPEYIAVTLYNICYAKNNAGYFLKYTRTIIITPTILKVTTESCTLVFIAPGNITVYSNPECSGTLIKQYKIYVTPCGIFTSKNKNICNPWALVTINIISTENGICTRARIIESSLVLARKWCPGVTRMYIWSGGLIKGVTR